MAARPLHLTHKSLFLKLLPRLPLLSSLKPHSSSSVLTLSQPSPRCVAFSTTSTPYPLQYDLIVNTPVLPRRSPRRQWGNPSAPSASADEGPDTSGSDESPAVEMEFDDWVEKKLSSDRPGSRDRGLDRAQRKYLRKREKRLYGSDSEDERKGEGGFVELKPKVVDFDRLHEREQELYFYDAFAYPWDKDKHYKMVYKLEKKYFPDHCLDKAFIDEREYNEAMKGTKNELRRKKGNKGGVDDGDRKFVFFDEDVVKEKEGKKSKGERKDLVVEKKVEEFFKCLKKFPSEGEDGGDGEPYLVTRSTELPPRWDGPNGTVVLINKPKGWTSFTVCGKLRRLVKVKKVGHAGTLDPMATGLLIVCVGKATKLADE